MDNTIFLLTGHAGVGKLTVAREIAALTGARVIDNHYVNNPIFGLIELSGEKPLPEAVWSHVGAVRRAVHETIVTLSPPEWSFVFTLVAYDDKPRVRDIFNDIREVARRRGARFQPVRLICEVEELRRRIAMPGRREQLKDISPDSALENFAHPLLTLDDARAIDLDVTNMPAKEATRRIVAAAELLA